LNRDGLTCAGVVGTFTYAAALQQAVAQAGSSGIARYVNFVNGVVNYYFRLHSFMCGWCVPVSDWFLGMAAYWNVGLSL